MAPPLRPTDLAKMTSSSFVSRVRLMPRAEAAATSIGSSACSTCSAAPKCLVRRAAKVSATRDESEKSTAARTMRGGNMWSDSTRATTDPRIPAIAVGAYAREEQRSRNDVPMRASAIMMAAHAPHIRHRMQRHLSTGLSRRPRWPSLTSVALIVLAAAGPGYAGDQGDQSGANTAASPSVPPTLKSATSPAVETPDLRTRTRQFEPGRFNLSVEGGLGLIRAISPYSLRRGEMAAGGSVLNFDRNPGDVDFFIPASRQPLDFPDAWSSFSERLRCFGRTA